MTEMFASAKRPFYQSTQMMALAEIDESLYYDFANDFFGKRIGHWLAKDSGIFIRNSADTPGIYSPS